MATFQEMKAAVQNALADDSTKAETWAGLGINAGIQVAGLIFEPPEMHAQEPVVAVSSSNYIGHGMTRHLRTEMVYNITGSCPVYPLPFRALNVWWLPTSGNVQFYCLHGQYLHYRPQPTSNETLRFNIVRYPAELQDGQNFPFGTSYDFVIAFATRYAWACKEEVESANMWEKIATDLGAPEQRVAAARMMMKELPDDDISRALQQGLIPTG